MFSPDKGYTVFEQSEWWSDRWDPKSYWREFDFSKTFFAQFNELMHDVPQVSLAVQDSDNSEYTNYAINNKNCYLTFGWDYSQDCEYGNFQFYTNNCVDFYWLIKCENCYECINCNECFKTTYSRDSKNLTDCHFCLECNSCNDCIGCTNLSNKKCYLFNKPSTKEEIDKIRASFSSFSKLNEFKAKAEEFFAWETFKFADIRMSENCTWDKIFSSKNCNNCFVAETCEDLKDVYIWINCKDVRNSSLVGFWSQYVYDSFWITSGVNLTFTAYAWWNNRDMFYTNQCYNNCSNLFGCIWLRGQSYCILNKQYTKEEYEAIVPKIIEHMISTWEWWEFFPASVSQFWYNESVASEYFPLSKEKAIEKWFNWSDYENPKPEVSKVIPASKLPDNISDIPDDILNWAVLCEKTERPFRIIKAELDFYRKQKLPVPRKHPDERHLDRMKNRNNMKLYDRKCDSCWIDIKTTYAPDRTEKILCEDCYNKLMK